MIQRWLFSTNAKDISTLYLIFGLFSGLIGSSMSLIIRMELASPGVQILQNNNQLYNVLISGHGVLMIFFMVMPSLMGWAGNFFLPLMQGAPDMSYPRLNNISFWLLIPALISLVIATLVEGGPGAGWTLYYPLTSIQSHSGSAIDLTIFALHLTSISSLLGAINFIATALNMRAPGITLLKLPLFSWSILITAVLLLLSLPVLSAGVTMIITDRNFNSSFYETASGGDVLLYQHLFYKLSNIYLLLLYIYIIYNNILININNLNLLTILISLINNLKLNILSILNLSNIILNKELNKSYPGVPTIFNPAQKEKKVLLSISENNLIIYEKIRKLLNLNKLDNDFISWLVGFTEGDGSFIITKKGNLCLVITQDTKDIQVLNYIKQKLGYGQVIKQGITTSRFIIQNNLDLYLICLLFNKQIVLPSKLNSFIKLVKHLNIKIEKGNFSRKLNKKYIKDREILSLIKPINIINKPLIYDLNSAWLSGFIDAEGCIFSYIKQNQININKYTFILGFDISQKHLCNKIILDKLINLLNSGNVYKHSVPDIYYYRLTGINNFMKLIIYLEKYNLKTKKYKELLLIKNIINILSIKKTITNSKFITQDNKFNYISINKLDKNQILILINLCNMLSKIKKNY